VELISDYDLLVVTGPTASGKTSLAVTVGKMIGGEIISADSRQVYRGMNLGTGKDYDDYLVDNVRIPCHLIDIADPGYKYSVFEYQRDFIKVYSGLKKRDVFPVVCGGSGMYADSIITGYKMVEVPPEAGLRVRLEKKSIEELRAILTTYTSLHNTTDTGTKKRIIRAIEIAHYDKNNGKLKGIIPKLKSLVVGINCERELRRKRITDRLKKRLEDGMVEEVKSIINSGVSTETLIYYGLEYKFITLYLTGKLTYDEMVRDLEIAIHQFAKRQMTWFRGMERKGIKIHWLDSEIPTSEKADLVTKLLTNS
jgi:tRNA dimethylallyltransferase